jgi:hypothetical protein
LKCLINSSLSALQLGVSFGLLNNLPQSFSPWFLNMGASTSSYATAGIALRVSGALKPHHHDKVETPLVGVSLITARKEKALLRPLCRYFILNKGVLTRRADFKTFYNTKLRGYQITLESLLSRPPCLYNKYEDVATSSGMSFVHCLIKYTSIGSQVTRGRARTHARTHTHTLIVISKVG